MRFAKWFQSHYPRVECIQSTKARPNSGGRRVSFETLEDRRVLAAFDLTASLLSESEPNVDLAAPTSIARNLGDFYYSGSEQIPLLRYDDRFVVRIAEASLRDGIVSALTASGAPLAGYTLASAINSNTLILSKASDQQSLPIALTQAESVAGVEWVTPLFQAGAGGAWIAVNDEVIVALKPGVTAAEFFDSEFSSWRPLLGTPDQFVATLADGAGLESLVLANTLHTNPAVQWAVPNFYADVKQSFTPSDPLFSSQWHLNNSGQTGAKVDADADLTEAWDTTQGNASVVIAVLDDGVQTNHPDLNIFTNPGEIAGNSLDDDGNGWIDDVNGWNFVPTGMGDNDPNPAVTSDNHGTAVAGVAAAKGNTTGVSGSSRNARILPVKVFEGGSFVGYARAAEALYYAAGRTANGLGTWDAADIINMSFGTAGMTTNAAFDAAVAWATSSGRQGTGASIFAAAGNDADGTNSDPAYKHFSLTGITPGNYVIEWRYEKDNIVSQGDDTVWLANVQLPNGARQRFDTPGMPAGWSTTSTTGQANTLWSVVDDPAHSYGTGRYVARSGDIGDSQITRFRSPQITVTTTGVLEYDAWVSTEDGFDFLRVYLSTDGVNFDPYLAASGVPTVNTAVSYPANLTNAIAVGASTDWDYRSAYSQYGTALDLVAPSSGGDADIPTTDRTGAAGYNSTSDYADFTGTSSATPLTAGIAALMLSKNPHLSPSQIRTILQNSADKVGGNNGATAYDVSGFNQYFGYGRVNAHEALTDTPVDTIGPKILDVTLRGAVAGSAWTPGVKYEFSDLVAAGDQLRPVATQNVNTISIQFSEPVRKRASATGVLSDIASTIADGNLLMELKRTVNPANGSFDNATISATAFTYDATTNIATWTFPSLADDKYAIHLKSPSASQAGVVDNVGNALNGEWANDDAGTPDDFTDDPEGALQSGGSTAGSMANKFRFHFALLAGDYDGDGLVEHAQESATGDGNGDHVVNAADTTIGVNGKRLPVQKFGGADFNDDEIVDGFDLTIWKAGFGGTVAGDVDGDGDTDGSDFLIWQRVNGSKSAWHVDTAGVVAALTVGAPPQVSNVIVSGSQSTHSPYSFSNVDGSGAQLKSVPVGGADTVSIIFSEGVNVSAESLIVVGLQSASLPTLAEFVYDAATNMASWRFDGWRADNYLLALSDAVTDVDGNRLDGEWTNPASTLTVNAAISEFPSGDGVAGGWFNFMMTLLPGDAQRNSFVGTADYNIWAANVNNPAFDTGARYIDGDMDGDGDVDQTDYDLGFVNYQVEYRHAWMLADLNGDWKVDAADIAVIDQNANMTGATRAQGDLNGDGTVDMDDLDLAYSQYGLAISVVS